VYRTKIVRPQFYNFHFTWQVFTEKFFGLFFFAHPESVLFAHPVYEAVGKKEVTEEVLGLQIFFSHLTPPEKTPRTSTFEARQSGHLGIVYAKK